MRHKSEIINGENNGPLESEESSRIKRIIRDTVNREVRTVFSIGIYKGNKWLVQEGLKPPPPHFISLFVPSVEPPRWIKDYEEHGAVLSSIEEPFRIWITDNDSIIPPPRDFETATKYLHELWAPIALERLKFVFHKNTSSTPILIRDRAMEVLAEIQTLDVPEKRAAALRVSGQFPNDPWLSMEEVELLRVKYGFYEQVNGSVLPTRETGDALGRIQFLKYLNSLLPWGTQLELDGVVNTEDPRHIFRSEEAKAWFMELVEELGVFQPSGDLNRGGNAKLSAIFSDLDCKDLVFRYDLQLLEYVDYVNERFGCELNRGKLSAPGIHQRVVQDRITQFKKEQARNVAEQIGIFSE